MIVDGPFPLSLLIFHFRASRGMSKALYRVPVSCLLQMKQDKKEAGDPMARVGQEAESLVDLLHLAVLSRPREI